MSKHTAPQVTWLDVLDNLPAVPHPLQWCLALRQAPAFPNRVYVCVELVLLRRTGPPWLFRRWGRECSTRSPVEVMKVALVSAQEAYLYLDGIDPDELRKRVEWEHGAQEFKG